MNLGFYEINYLMGACCVREESVNVEKNNIIKNSDNDDDYESSSFLSSCLEENIIEKKNSERSEEKKIHYSGPILQLLIKKSQDDYEEVKNIC